MSEEQNIQETNVQEQKEESPESTAQEQKEESPKSTAQEKTPLMKKEESPKSSTPDASPKVNVGPVLTEVLAKANSGLLKASEKISEGSEKLKVSEKLSSVKEHPVASKISQSTEVIWVFVGLALILHGAQFKNLFLCTQVILLFCYAKVKGSTASLYNDVTTALTKMRDEDPTKPEADAKAEATPSNKHAAKRNSQKDATKPADEQKKEDVAKTKKMLKLLDTDKLTGAVFELLVAYMACHMVMQGGLARVVVVTHALVKGCRPTIASLLVFGEHTDVQAWSDLLIDFALYFFFGLMATVAGSLAFALNVALYGAQLVLQHGHGIPKVWDKITNGQSVEEFTASTKGLAVLGGLTAFGTVWQFWALMAGSGMHMIFKIIYLPAVLGEGTVGLFSGASQ